MDPVG